MSPNVAAPTINNYSDELRKLLDEAMPKEGEVLIFKQIFQETKKDAVNEDNVPVQFTTGPRSLRITRLETIIDPGNGRPITIGNLKGYAANGQGVQAPNIGEVVFGNSGNNIIQVGAEDPILCERLLLSNKNRDSINPKRKEPESGYGFYMLKPAAEADSEYEREMKVGEALAVVKGLKSNDDKISDDLRAIAGKLSLPLEDRGRKLTEKELLVRLTGVAKADPERMMNLVSAGENKLEQLIGKAEKLELVEFVEETQQWVWKATQERICEAVQGHKPAEALVRYIQTNANGTNFSRMLVNRVKQEEKDKKGKAPNA